MHGGEQGDLFEIIIFAVVTQIESKSVHMNWTYSVVVDIPQAS